MSARILSLTLDEHSGLNLPASLLDERNRAIDALLKDNQFLLTGDGLDTGPYHLSLRTIDKKLILEVCTEARIHCCDIPLLLLPLRSLMKDYHLVCESYYKAVREASAHKIEALDMGRRGLHNEGAEIVQQQLKGTAECDFATARRLFTLMFTLFLPSLR